MVVFATTCKNRTDHLRKTLPRNLADNPDSRFVVLDYNSGDDLIPFLRTLEGPIADRQLTVYSYAGWPKFRMAHAKNMAHRLGIVEGGQVIVNLDADNFAGPNFHELAQEMVALGPDVFLWANMVKGEMDRGISGRIAVSPQQFRKVGGYDEKYFAWASDDKDLNLRLRMVGYQGIEIDKRFLSAVKHNNKLRFKEYPHLASSPESYFTVDPSCIKKAVVNDGRVGCGTVYRNFDRDDIVDIKPVATRVFGVGLSKTATSSLHKAFRILGYDSWHWSSAHTAKAIWQEMNTNDRSLTVERFEALCDLPIPLLYQKLDAAYPGSKFVLTIRNEAKWLDSMRRHFMAGHNPWKANWNNDPFTHRVHQLTYGRCDFDAEMFLERYRQHNAEVMEYFKFRPESLVVLRMDKGDGWQKLCAFLDKPIPSIPFPHVNKSNLWSLQQ
jgi:hypothetical protein